MTKRAQVIPYPGVPVPQAGAAGVAPVGDAVHAPSESQITSNVAPEVSWIAVVVLVALLEHAHARSASGASRRAAKRAELHGIGVMGRSSP